MSFILELLRREVHDAQAERLIDELQERLRQIGGPMSNYPPGVTDDDPYFTDENESEGEEEPDAPPTSEPRTTSRTGSGSSEDSPRTS